MFYNIKNEQVEKSYSPSILRLFIKLRNETEYQPPKQLIEECKNSFRKRKQLEEEKEKLKKEKKEKHKKKISNSDINC